MVKKYKHSVSQFVSEVDKETNMTITHGNPSLESQYDIFDQESITYHLHSDDNQQHYI